MVEVEKYNKVLLKYSHNCPHQYAKEKSEKEGKWRELALLTLFPFGSMIPVTMWHVIITYMRGNKTRDC